MGKRDIFIEYRLDYITNDGPENLVSYKLTYLLKYARINNISKYTISGLKKDEWNLILKIG